MYKHSYNTVKSLKQKERNVSRIFRNLTVCARLCIVYGVEFRIHINNLLHIHGQNIFIKTVTKHTYRYIYSKV